MHIIVDFHVAVLHAKFQDVIFLGVHILRASTLLSLTKFCTSLRDKKSITSFKIALKTFLFTNLQSLGKTVAKERI